jgi:transcriptional regulator with XRE-family HTH domain
VSDEQIRVDGLKNLSITLKAAREERGMSISELARRSGMSRSMIHEFENGKNISIDTLFAYCREIGISVYVEPLIPITHNRNGKGVQKEA